MMHYRQSAPQILKWLQTLHIYKSVISVIPIALNWFKIYKIEHKPSYL